MALLLFPALTACGKPSPAHVVCDELKRGLEVLPLTDADKEEAYLHFLLAQKAALDLTDGDPLKEAVLAAGDGDSVSPYAVAVIWEDHC